jgi:diadenylate cyclase
MGPLAVIGWRSVFDFVVLLGATYVLLRWSSEAKALRVVFVVLALHVAASLTRHLHLLITPWILDAAAMLGVVAVVLVFHSEVRSAIARLETALVGTRPKRSAQTLQAISAAASLLADARRGALIVIVRHQPIDELVVGGLPLDGRVSAEILEAIYADLSPVHDGAAIIQGDRVTHVGAILPLSHSADLPEAYGTRHRAALGLSERCDAAVIVVSEERGQITVMHNGRIEPVDAADDLVEALGELADPGERAPLARRVDALLRRNLALKAVTVMLAVAIWSTDYVAAPTSVETRTAAVVFANVPQTLVVADHSPEVMTVQLRGADALLDSVDSQPLVARIDLNRAHAGINQVKVDVDVLSLPPGIFVEYLSPRTLNVELVPAGRAAAGR